MDEIPVIVRRTSIAAEAMLMQEQLTARGIHCWLNERQPGALVPYEQRPSTENAITVWSGDEDLARDLLDRLTRRRPQHTEVDDAPARSG